MEKQEQIFNGKLIYGYYDYDDFDAYIGPLQDEINVLAVNLEDAIRKINDNLGTLIAENNKKGDSLYSPVGIEVFIEPSNMVYKTGWKKFDVYCVERVLDAFDDFQSNNPLLVQTVYATNEISAKELVQQKLQEEVNRARQGFLSSGTFTVLTEIIKDAEGNIVFEYKL